MIKNKRLFLFILLLLPTFVSAADFSEVSVNNPLVKYGLFPLLGLVFIYFILKAIIISKGVEGKQSVGGRIFVLILALLLVGGIVFATFYLTDTEDGQELIKDLKNKMESSGEEVEAEEETKTEASEPEKTEETTSEQEETTTDEDPHTKDYTSTILKTAIGVIIAVSGLFLLRYARKRYRREKRRGPRIIRPENRPEPKIPPIHQNMLDAIYELDDLSQTIFREHGGKE